MLNNKEIAIVTAHTMRRFLKAFEIHERTKEIELVMARTYKFLTHEEKHHKADFVYATEIERALYHNAVMAFDGETPIFALDFSVRLYEYYPKQLKRYANISEKIMEKIDITATKRVVAKEKEYEIESNSSDLLDEYIKQLAPLTGVQLKKSAFAGKKLTIKNNMILDGKKVAAGF